MPSILHISDWHARHEEFAWLLERAIKRYPEILDADAIFFTGDMVANFPSKRSAYINEARQRGNWQIMVEHTERLFPSADIFAVRGNHDFFDVGVPGVYAFDKLGGQEYTWAGNKVWGFRGVTVLYGTWADEFREETMADICNMVPEDTEILVTHVPPYGILDEAGGLDPHIGSRPVRELVDRLPKLKLHLFGHCHESGENMEWQGNTLFSNAATGLNYLSF